MRVVAGRADVDDVDRFVSWLHDVGETHGCAVQAFDARYVADESHLTAAVERANRAFARGETVARERSVEILLYAAGRRQIDQAVEMGVPAGADVPMVVVVDADDQLNDADPDDTQLSGADSNDTETQLGGDSGGEWELDEIAAVEAIEKRLTVDESVLGRGRDEPLLREFFDISDAEVAVAATDLGGLVRERVALLDVEK